MGIFKNYEKAVWDVEHNNCTLGELEAAEQRLKDSIIEWHPYPQEKPTEEGIYLVTLENILGDRNVRVLEFKSKTFWTASQWSSVVAWAELPKPYEEGAEE